jgi:tryptophan synthase alpha chain
MNRINRCFHQTKHPVLNIFFTAGYPKLEDTRTIIRALDQAGVDMIEIGIPFSDPLADGPTIQQSSKQALDNGMTLALLFEQLTGVREDTDIPILLMGYLNPVMQYGIDAFLEKCAEIGIDGMILPDLPVYEYEMMYQQKFEQHELRNIFLISPTTSESRIRHIDKLGDGFIYMVSSSSTTGRTSGISAEQLAYFERIKNMQLHNPRLIGFGIKDEKSFAQASAHANGAIIGSAFIKMLAQSEDLERDIHSFVASIRPSLKDAVSQ